MGILLEEFKVWSQTGDSSIQTGPFYLISERKRGSQRECLCVFSSPLCNTVNFVLFQCVIVTLVKPRFYTCAVFPFSQTKSDVAKVTGFSFTWLRLAM